METVAGVDGCPGGWVAAVWGGAGVTWRALPLPFGEALAALGDCAVVAADVPIGLPEHGYRRCDLAARAALGAARSSVFLVPPRPVLEAPDYAAACATGRALHGKALSKQTWFLRERILGATDAADPRVVECHPEMSFLRLAGAPLPPKRAPAGRAARVAALGGTFGDVEALLRTAPRPAKADDALDALACAWTARRVLAGTATRLGDPPMEIVT